MAVMGKATTESAIEVVETPAVDVPTREEPKNGSRDSDNFCNENMRENDSIKTSVAPLEKANPKSLEAGVAEEKEGKILVDWDGPDDPENPRK